MRQVGSVIATWENRKDSEEPLWRESREKQKVGTGRKYLTELGVPGK